MKSIDAYTTETVISSEDAKNAVSPKHIIQAAQRLKSSRLPTPGGRKLTSVFTKQNKIRLEKRKPLDAHATDSQHHPASSMVPTDRPTSRFPKVPSDQPSCSVSPQNSKSQTRSPVIPLCSGTPESQLGTALPPIRSPDGAGRGRSRIPVRTRSVDCRAPRQAARRSTRSGSCGSVSGHQAACRSARSGSSGSSRGHQASRRSAQSGSSGSVRGHQASRRSARFGSCGSDNDHQAARRSSSCSSVSSQQRSSRRHSATSDWSIIDVNNNAKLVTPSLPHVKQQQHKKDSAVGRSWAMGCSTIPVRSPRAAAAVSLPSPNGPHPATPADPRWRRDSGMAGPGTPGGASNRHISKGTSDTASSTQGMLGAGRSSPKVSVVGSCSSKVSVVGRSSPKAAGTSCRPTMEYRPNLTPYPRQYTLLGMLGPDPDGVKRRQDKMSRRREYVERLARLSRAAVRRGTLVPVRVCSAGRSSPEHRLRPQSTPDVTSLQPGSEECVEGPESSACGDPAGPTSATSSHISTIGELMYPPEERLVMAEGSNKTCSTTELDGGRLTMGCSERNQAHSESGSSSESVSESVSESSLQWGPEDASLTTVDLIELKVKLEEAALEAITAEKSIADELVATLMSASEEAAGLSVPSMEMVTQLSNETMPSCEVELSEIVDQEPTGQPPILHDGMGLTATVAETDTIASLCPEAEAFSSDLTGVRSDEESDVETWASVPTWVRPVRTWARSTAAASVPVWAGRCTSVTVSEPAVAEEPKETKMSQSVTEPAETSPATLGFRVFAADTRCPSDAKSNSDPDSRSRLDSDSSDSSSDSDAEMEDAVEELPTATPPPDSLLPVLPMVSLLQEGSRREHNSRPARRCSSVDVFLDLPDPVPEPQPEPVVDGRCRGAGGCSRCNPPTAVSHATQVPDRRISFACYRNVLIMDIGSNGEAGWPERSEEARTWPRQGRRRRWSSCPVPLRVEDQSVTPGHVGSRWSEEALLVEEVPLEHRREA